MKIAPMGLGAPRMDPRSGPCQDRCAIARQMGGPIVQERAPLLEQVGAPVRSLDLVLGPRAPAPLRIKALRSRLVDLFVCGTTRASLERLRRVPFACREGFMTEHEQTAPRTVTERSWEMIEQHHLRRLAQIVIDDLEDFFRRYPTHGRRYRDRLMLICLCQGAARALRPPGSRSQGFRCLGFLPETPRAAVPLPPTRPAGRPAGFRRRHRPTAQRRQGCLRIRELRQGVDGSARVHARAAQQVARWAVVHVQLQRPSRGPGIVLYLCVLGRDSGLRWQHRRAL